MDRNDRAACSALADAAREPLLATAPRARALLVIEHDGRWERRALESPGLEARVAAQLDQRATDAGVRILLARRGGRSTAGSATAGAVRMFAYHAGGAEVERAELPALDSLLEVDLAELAAGRLPGLGPASSDPLVLVCTHGKRDRCCATHGRVVAEALRAGAGAEVWEVSHVGGHRFAANALVLPHGVALGRLRAADAADVVQRLLARGTVSLPHYRGRLGLEPAVQAGEHLLRDRHRAEALAAVLPAGATQLDAETWEVSFARGPSTTITVRASEGPPRAVSCDDDKVERGVLWGALPASGRRR